MGVRNFKIPIGSLPYDHRIFAGRQISSPMKPFDDEYGLTRRRGVFREAVRKVRRKRAGKRGALGLGKQNEVKIAIL
jgi:hypothetical protein